jgi:hypothetical protein
VSGPEDARRFTTADGEWLAWLSGAGAVGTGAWGLGHIEAVHFARSAEPARPLREALLPRGRFDGLFDAELEKLLAAAVPILDPADRPPRPLVPRGRSD